MMGTLQIENLAKSYGDLRVIDGFSHTFPASGVISLMGPSGCGKTTLLRLLAGLERPEAGAIRRPEQLKTAVVFQEDRLLEVLTARENISAVLPAGQRSRADTFLGQVGLLDAAEMYPGQMSGGMKRRLAIARAVAFDGGLLLMDEPFRGLDLETKRLVMDFVFPKAEKEAAAPFSKRLALLVTHDVDEALGVSAQILLLRGAPLHVWKCFDLDEKLRGGGRCAELRNEMMGLLEEQSRET